MSLVPRTGICTTCGHDHGNGMGLPSRQRDGLYSAAAASPVQGAASASGEAKVAAVDELLGQYWDLAYQEGATGKSNGSAANAVLSKLRAALADRSPAVQPVAGQEVQARLQTCEKLLHTRLLQEPGEYREIDFIAAMRYVRDELRDVLATQVPEQESVPERTQEMFLAAERAGVSFATQEKCWNAWFGPAPVPATTPAEQPEGDSSHVMRPFGAPAGQHGASGEVLTDVRIVELAEAWAMTSHAYQSTPLNHCLDFARAIEAELASGSREGRDGCLKCPRDPNKRCSYCGFDFLGAANTNKGGDA